MLLDSACECREKHTLEIKQQHKSQPTFRMDSSEYYFGTLNISTPWLRSTILFISFAWEVANYLLLEVCGQQMNVDNGTDDRHKLQTLSLT